MAEYKYTPENFKSDQQVKWCAGCGDHAVLNSVQRALPEVADALDKPHEKFVFISGIGCSSRFIYYMKTFGFHTIHGRAAAVATGVKVANPDLSVWVCSGDGDSLAIGGNHFIHALRRNVDLNIILFNNEIYGLTKGQYSPTTKLGMVTKTSPYGTVENPFNPGELAIGAKGTFFARTVDTEGYWIFREAHSGEHTMQSGIFTLCVVGKDIVNSISILANGYDLKFQTLKNKTLVIILTKEHLLTVAQGDSILCACCLISSE